MNEALVSRAVPAVRRGHGLFLLLTLAFAAVLVWQYVATLTHVTVSVDGLADRVATHQRTVGALLAEVGLAVVSEDRISPLPSAALTPGLQIVVSRARPAVIVADGTQRTLSTHAPRVGELLRAAGITLAAQDELTLNGAPVDGRSLLPPPAAESRVPRYRQGRAWVGRAPVPVTLSVRRAVPLTVEDGGVPLVIFTTAPTIGEALRREQFTLYLGDAVRPSLGSPVQAGGTVFIQRSLPVVFFADGETLKTRTRRHTVGDALAEQGILITGLDEVEPALSTPLVPNLAVRVVRVREELEIEQDVVGFTSIWVADDNLEIDQRAVKAAGQEGIKRRRFRVRYEDNQQVSRALEDAWVAQEPITRVLAYGRKIVQRSLETPDGQIAYWRKVRVYTTSYTAASAGRTPDDPLYGHTRIGAQVRTGIVAVDPTVIPLRSWMYVPGYGKAQAGDTGGGVKGKFVDLGYSEGEYRSWHWWSDIYLMWPPPPAYQIRWVLPDWPRYPDRG